MTLKEAIDSNNVERVKQLMIADPELHRAPMGYANDGPLTWVAECRVPWEPPSEARLEMARWMIANGSDVHQGGDGPLMRAALNRDRIAMMELLVAHGADVNARWHGTFPILFAPCESLCVESLQWLLEHGADPNIEPVSALDYLLSTYLREADRLRACYHCLSNAGARTKYQEPSVIAIMTHDREVLKALLDGDSTLIARHFEGLDFGHTAGRLLTLEGATLLHVAAEYNNVEAATVLLDRGANINARGAFGQTPLFHAATQFDDEGLEVVRLLLARGADASMRATVPGHYERPGEMVECSAGEYASLFPGGESETVTLLVGKKIQDNGS